MITHYIGRPDSNEGRSEVETRTYDFLDSLGIRYETVCHEAAFTMEQCQEIEKTLGVPICKNLFLCNRQQTQFYLLMLPGDKHFKTKIPVFRARMRQTVIRGRKQNDRTARNPSGFGIGDGTCQ